MQVTVIITVWKRFKNIEKILSVWLKDPDVGEVIVWDNSGTFKTDLPVTVISSNKNWGACVRWILAGIVKNEILLFVDDDIMIEEGVTQDLLKYYTPDRLLGVYGRNFHGSYQSSDERGGASMENAEKVDFILGYLLMGHRKHFLGHYYGDDNQIAGDLLVQARNMDKERWVVPSKKWSHLPESSDRVK